MREIGHTISQTVEKPLSVSDAMRSESAHGHCLVGFTFKSATRGIRCSSAAAYQTVLHYCRAPPSGLGGGLPVFVVRPHAPSREVRTMTVVSLYMYHYTNIHIYIYIYI